MHPATSLIGGFSASGFRDGTGVAPAPPVVGVFVTLGSKDGKGVEPTTSASDGDALGSGSNVGKGVFAALGSEDGKEVLPITSVGTPVIGNDVLGSNVGNGVVGSWYDTVVMIFFVSFE